MPRSKYSDALSTQVKEWTRLQYDRYVEFEKYARQFRDEIRVFKCTTSQPKTDDTCVDKTQDPISNLREAAFSPKMMRQPHYDISIFFEKLSQSYNQITTECARHGPKTLMKTFNELTNIAVRSLYTYFTNGLECSFKRLSCELEKHNARMLKDILCAFEDSQKRNPIFVQHVVMSILSLTPLLENNSLLQEFYNPRQPVFEGELSLSGPVFKGLLYSGALVETGDRNIQKYYRQFNIRDKLIHQIELHACLQKNPRALQQAYASVLSVIRELTRMSWVYSDGKRSLISLSNDPLTDIVRAYPELTGLIGLSQSTGEKQTTKELYEMRLRLYAEWKKAGLISPPPSSPSNAELGGVFMRLCDDIILNMQIIAIDSAHEKKSRDEVSVPLVSQLPCDKNVTASYSLSRQTRHECIKENVELAHTKLSKKTGIRQRRAADLLKLVGCRTDLMARITSRDIFYHWLSLLPNKDQQDIVDYCVEKTCGDYDVANQRINTTEYLHLQALMVLGCSTKVLETACGKLPIRMTFLSWSGEYGTIQQWQKDIQERCKVSLDQLRTLRYQQVAGTDHSNHHKIISGTGFANIPYWLNDNGETYYNFTSMLRLLSCLGMVSYVYSIGFSTIEAIDVVIPSLIMKYIIPGLSSMFWGILYIDHIDRCSEVLKKSSSNYVEQEESENKAMQHSKKQSQRQHQNPKKQRLPENDENKTVTLIEKTSKSAPSAPTAPLTTQSTTVRKEPSEEDLLKARKDEVEKKFKDWEGKQSWGEKTQSLLKAHLLEKCKCIDNDTLTEMLKELERKGVKINREYKDQLGKRIKIEKKHHLMHLKTVIFAVCKERRELNINGSRNEQRAETSKRVSSSATTQAHLITQASSPSTPISGIGEGEGEGEGEVNRKEDSDASYSVSGDESTRAESVDLAFDKLITKLQYSCSQLHEDVTGLDEETTALGNLFNNVLALLNAIKSPDCKLTYAEFKQQLIVAFTKYDELVTSSMTKDKLPGYVLISSYRDDLDQVRKLVGSSTNEDIKKDLSELAKGSLEQRFVFVQFAKMEIVTPSFLRGKISHSSPLISSTSTAFSWQKLVPESDNGLDFLLLCRYLLEHALHEREEKKRETANEYLHRNFVVSEFPALSIPKQSKRSDIRAEQHIASAQFFLQQLLNHFHELESVDRWGVLCIVTDRLSDAIKPDRPDYASEHVKKVLKLTDSSKRQVTALPHYKAMRESRNDSAHNFVISDTQAGLLGNLVNNKDKIEMWHKELSKVLTNDQTTRAPQPMKRTQPKR